MIALAYGERAVFVELGAADAPDRAARTHAAARALAQRFPSADVVLGGGCLALVGVDPARTLEALAAAPLGDAPPPRVAPARHAIDVVYDGPDLDAIAAQTSLSREAVVALHAGRDYVVELCGFLPGFAYLGPLDPRLVLPRRASPRPRVAAGSVGVAGTFTGVYPLASPGGWHLLGRAVGARLFSPTREPACALAPGDVVRFQPIDPRDAPPDEKEPLAAEAASSAPVLEILSAPPGATVQDGGRPGLLGRGIPPSGPLDPDAHAAANLCVGNAEDAAALEIPLGGAELLARSALVVSIDGEPSRALSPGDRLLVAASPRAVRYVAIAGGLDVPRVLGARATLVPARLGGVAGRPLRRGDTLAVGGARLANADGPRPAPKLDVPAEAILDVDPGPHLARFPPGALGALASGAFTISALGDRVGVRLDGAKIPREGGDLGLPAPMLRGAMQIATDGTPIVLGPDHPTTGGYPVLAVVRLASQALLARLRPGASLRFRVH